MTNTTAYRHPIEDPRTTYSRTGKPERANPLTRRRCRYALLLLVILHLPLSGAREPVLAQSSPGSAARTIVGGFGSMGFGPAMPNIPVFAGAGSCGTFESGTTLEWRGGASFAADEIAGPVGLSMSLWIGGARSTLSTPPPVPARIFDTRANSIVELEREYRRETTELRAGLDLMPSIDLGPFWLAAGPTLALNLTSSTEQTDNVTGPGAIRFGDGQSSRTMDASHASTPAPASVGAAFELSRRIPVASLIAVPWLSGRFDVTSRITDAAVRAITIEAGVRILVDLTPSAAPLAVSVIETQAPEPIPPLHASLAIYGVDPQGQRQAAPRITMTEIQELDHVPIVPAIFFDAGSDALASRYRGGASEAALDVTVLLQRRLLDTLGARLTARPNGRLTLHGSTATDESAELADGRVKAVRRYLAERWGIDPSRVASGETRGTLARSSELDADGRDDNRRVEIASSEPELMAPIVLSRTQRRFDPPALELVPTIDAGAGVAEWSIVVTQGGRTAARFSSHDTKREHPIWEILPSDSDTLGRELVARLDVTDSIGHTVAAEARTVVQVAREHRQVDGRSVEMGDRTVSRHLLVAFEFDRAEPGALNLRQLEAIAQKLTPGARVRVLGSADRIGEREHNVELARRRADAVASALRAFVARQRIESVTVETSADAGESGRFTNDLPEGRFLSRGVEVVVEQQR
jgi:outer membrane protein OmpA-like peptidoglycan-associated protein